MKGKRPEKKKARMAKAPYAMDLWEMSHKLLGLGRWGECFRGDVSAMLLLVPNEGEACRDSESFCLVL